MGKNLTLLLLDTLVGCAPKVADDIGDEVLLVSLRKSIPLCMPQCQTSWIRASDSDERGSHKDSGQLEVELCWLTDVLDRTACPYGMVVVIVGSLLKIDRVDGRHVVWP